MILVRSPLRITLGGGGTDVPSYYSRYGGFCISAAIDKYVYVSVTQPFKEGIFLKYAEHELVYSVEFIRHPIIRESLREINHFERKIEIVSLADIPSGTGLGSSGSFTTALLKALHVFYRKPISQGGLANLACKIEITKLKEPIGKQDQFIAAYGGVTVFDFWANESVEARPLRLSQKTLCELEDNLLLFFTGYSRSAGGVLLAQVAATESRDMAMIENLHTVKSMGIRSMEALERGDTGEFGEILNEHWVNKRMRSYGMSNTAIDEWYSLGIANGAIGGKLVGAGGGGFLMFYAKDRDKLRDAMSNVGLEEVRFRFDHEGTKVILS